MSQADPITTEVVRNFVISCAEDMNASLWRSAPIFNISLKKINSINELKKSMALQTLIFRIFMRPLVGGLKRSQTTVLRRFRAGGAICIA